MPKVFSRTIGSKASESIARAFIIQGFKNFITANGHTEYTAPIQLALRKLDEEFPKVGLFAVNTFRLRFVAIRKLIKTGKAGHALKVESLLASVFEPKNVHLCKALTRPLRLALPDRYISETGVDKTEVGL